MQTESLVDNFMDTVETGPAGLPFAYGLDAEPLTTRAAAALFEDLARRTLHTTVITLPDGRPAIVRTICLVFEDRLATCVADELPDNYVPQIFGSAVYSGEPHGSFLRALWTYGLPAEAKAGHAEAVEEFKSGRASVVGLRTS